jgi:hypothetical protein
MIAVVLWLYPHNHTPIPVRLQNMILQLELSTCRQGSADPGPVAFLIDAILERLETWKDKAKRIAHTM